MTRSEKVFRRKKKREKIRNEKRRRRQEARHRAIRSESRENELQQLVDERAKELERIESQNDPAKQS